MDGDNAEEIWAAIPDFSYYEVSSHGKVRAIARHVQVVAQTRRYKSGLVKNVETYTRFKKSYLFNPRYVDGTGYTVFLTSDRGIEGHFVVARLMLSAFVRLPNPGEVARHLDDNNRQNNLSNLAWGTPKDNAEDASRNGRLPKGSSHHNSKLTEEQVKTIKQRYKYGSRVDGCYAIARDYNVNHTTIHAIVNGGWNHV